LERKKIPNQVFFKKERIKTPTKAFRGLEDHIEKIIKSFIDKKMMEMLINHIQILQWLSSQNDYKVDVKLIKENTELQYTFK